MVVCENIFKIFILISIIVNTNNDEIDSKTNTNDSFNLDNYNSLNDNADSTFLEHLDTKKTFTYNRNLDSKPNLSPPDLDIYIDSLCPFSLKLLSGPFNDFFNNPSRDKLVNSFNIHVYGKTEEKFGSKPYDRKFKCNHGTKECITNRIENCALNILDKEEAMKFLICFSTDLKKETKKESQFDQSTLTCEPYKYQEIIECTYNGLGYELMHEESLKSVDVDFTPWIVINGVSDGFKSRKISKDIVGFLCDYLNLTNKLEGCIKK